MTAVGVAALDANVLVPIVACDFLLTAFDRGLFEPVVSATVLDEVERALLENFPHIDPGGLRQRVGHMRLALADHVVDMVEGNMPDAINPKDRHMWGHLIRFDPDEIAAWLNHARRPSSAPSSHRSL